MLVRCTKKLLAVLSPGLVLESAAVPGMEDWYANLAWFDRCKCLLLTHAGTLFTVFEPDVRARDLRPAQAFIVGLIARELAAEDLAPDTFGVLAGETFRIAGTTDRSVLGCMNDMAHMCGHAVANAGGFRHTDVSALNRALHRNINSARAYARPIDLARARTTRPAP